MATARRYNPTLKTRNDLVEAITPLVFSDLGAPQNPHGPFIPAPWLPVEWQDTVSKDWFVISTGKVVALTKPLIECWVVPAGLKPKWAAAAGGDTILTYTANDYDVKVMDLTTGETYATNGTTNYTKTQVQTALRARGLITAAATPDAYISKPVGAVLGDVYVWAGGNGWNPGHLNFQNYQKQKGIQFTSFAQMILPLVPAVHVAVSVPGGVTAGTPAFGNGNVAAVTDADGLARYSDVTNANVVAWFLADYPIATDTDRTPVTGSATDFLVREVKVDLPAYATTKEAITAAINSLTTAGDYFIDYSVGVVWIWSSGGATVPSNANSETFTYYSYTAAPGTVERYTCAVGNLLGGDKLMVDSNSNFKVWDGSAEEDILGKVVQAVMEPRDFMAYVRTAWAGSGFTAQQQMSGSASKGFSSQITYSDAADILVRVVLNVI